MKVAGELEQPRRHGNDDRYHHPGAQAAMADQRVMSGRGHRDRLWFWLSRCKPSMLVEQGIDNPVRACAGGKNRVFCRRKRCRVSKKSSGDDTGVMNEIA
jgi:hypothetical protein